MTNAAQRLLLFFIAVPSIILAIFFLPFFHHAALVALVLVFSVGSARELASLYKAEGIQAKAWMVMAIALVIPSLFYLGSFFEGFRRDFLPSALALAFLLLFSPFAFAKKEKLGETLAASAAYAFSFLYIGILTGFIVLIVSGGAQASSAILTFAAMVMGNDSLAWLCGVTMGKRRNLFAVSPNKSLEGFLGGMAGSIVAIFLMRAIFPAAITASPWLLVLMALAVGFATVLGDLFESALKRSVGAKDSGTKVLGRGGFLDSFDSLLFAAPVFYLASKLLGLFA